MKKKNNKICMCWFEVKKPNIDHTFACNDGLVALGVINSSAF